MPTVATGRGRPIAMPRPAAISTVVPAVRRWGSASTHLAEADGIGLHRLVVPQTTLPSGSAAPRRAECDGDVAGTTRSRPTRWQRSPPAGLHRPVPDESWSSRATAVGRT
jgi:hypothetical protein